VGITDGQNWLSHVKRAGLLQIQRTKVAGFDPK
jgi:hypothetical protein